MRKRKRKIYVRGKYFVFDDKWQKKKHTKENYKKDCSLCIIMKKKTKILKKECSLCLKVKKKNENARKEYTLCLLMNGKKNI